MSNSSNEIEYWQEAFELWLEGVGLWYLVEQMTQEQRREMGDSLATSHDCHSMAFYTPPPSDRYNQIERDWQAKYDALQKQYERFQDTADSALGRALKLQRGSRVTISDDGRCYLNDGRMTQIL